MSSPSSVHAKAIELGKQALKMTTAAGSGHPTSALSLAHVVVELMYRQMRFDPRDPWNPANDRLVLSEGHAVPIVYAAYADLGGAVGRDRANPRYLTSDDLASLRELDSVLDGHPNPAEGFPFFDAATGSLGQGLSVGAGLALGARLDGIDKRIFVLMGDGEAREGQVWEAADFIADHRLTSVCALFSCNGHGQADAVSPQQSPERLAAKLEAFSWDVVTLDGHDPEALAKAFARAGKGDRPLAIVARTVKGWGVASTLGKNFHGKPIPAADLDGACAELDDTAAQFDAVNADPIEKPNAPASTPAVAAKAKIKLPSFEDALRQVGKESALEKKKLATRVAYGVALVALGDADDRIVALDGDVSNSTFSDMFAATHPSRFFECKIAEQNMVSAGAGLSATGKIPFASTFGKFFARAVDQIDMAVISRANLKLVGSHSGVSLGADGPSQMSVSEVAYLRSMTRVDNGQGGVACHLFNPSDPISAYRCCELMAGIDGLCYLRTHRPDAAFLYPLDEQFAVGEAKKLRDGKHLTLVSSGYIMHTVLEATKRLSEAGVECSVFDAFCLPLDVSPILEAARASGGRILTVEDNYAGGLHAELAEAAAAVGDVTVQGMTVSRIPKSAKSADEVFDYVGVGLSQVMDQAKTLAGS